MSTKRRPPSQGQVPSESAIAPTPRSWRRRVWDFARGTAGWVPFSWAGLLVTAGCALALFHYGLKRIDLVLLGVGVVGLGLVVLSLLFTLVAAVVTWLSVRKQVAGTALRLECGYFAATGFSVPTLWYLPFVHVSWTWLMPQATIRLAARRRRMHEEILPRRRITTGTVLRRFEVGDIFGLMRIAFERREERTIRFLPWTGALNQMHVVRGMSGGSDISHPLGPAEGDRYDMRRYAPGDPIRFVLWKIFAKTRDLLIRTPEQAIAPARQTLAYLVAANTDEAAAGAARVAVDVGAFGTEWKFGADGCSDVADSRDHALDILVKSASASADQSGAGLGGFLSHATKGGLGRAIVFVPPKPGPWLKRVIAAAAAKPGQVGKVEFVVGTDGIDRAPRRSWLARLALGKRREDPTAPVARTTDAELATVVRTLGGARLSVLVVDRAAGQVFAQQHLSALRGAAAKEQA